VQDTEIVGIIRLCREMDETACDVYAKLRDLCDDKQLSEFWKEMTKAEAEHVAFWKRAERVEAFTDMPGLFGRPGEVISELRRALSLSRDLLRSCDGKFSTSKAFTLAFRLEFYLLHPAFETLFGLLGPFAGGTNPRDAYESHINGFVAMLAKQGEATPARPGWGRKPYARIRVRQSPGDPTPPASRTPPRRGTCCHES